MGIFEKANVIELNQEDLQDAKSTANLFKDDLTQRRAVANVIAARSALKLLFSLNIEATNLYSMYSINKVLEKLDIADVYAGNVRIDARLVNDSKEIFIPKSHFNLGITPDLYLILKYNNDSNSVEFLGCINPDEIDKSLENKDYYFVNEDLLYNLKIFKNLVKNNLDKQIFVPSQEDIERAENLIVPLEDDNIFNADYEFLIKQLAFNINLRQKAVEFENFEFVSKKVVTDETVYGDSVLGLVGSEKLYNRNEFTTDIDLDELSDTTVDDFVEDFDNEPSSIPEMNELTGEVSLDDALSQMDDSFGLNDEETQSDDEIIDVPQEDYEELPVNNNLDEIINNVSEIKDYSDIEEENEYEEDLEEAPSLPNEEETLEIIEDNSDNDDDDYKINDEEEDDNNHDESDDEDLIDFDDESDESELLELPDLEEFSDNYETTDKEVSNEEHYDELPEIQEEPIEATKAPSMANNTSQSDDIADLPTLKIVDEDEETYQKKMYKNAAMDDLKLESINLDDFDDYEEEDKEADEKQNKELNEMMSDLDNILNNGNISLDDVEDILTDEEITESLKTSDNEDNAEQAENSAENINENSADNQQPSEEVNPENNNQENESISLDDFLNSSFNEMSSKPENNDTIENNQELDSIYQTSSEDMEDTIIRDNPNILLTDEATMVDNSQKLYETQADPLTQMGNNKPKSKAPQLMVVLIILLCACAYVNKDIIMDNLNISFPKKAEEPATPEFDINSLKEPTPEEGANPIPNLPQPTDMPDTAPIAPPAPVANTETAQPQPQKVGTVPQNTSNKISKLSWEVPENMANNPKIKKYLQIAGRTLKLSLQNDLLVASELPFSNRVMVDLKIAPSGNLISTDFVISSGSKQIDNIVLQSVKDTLKYVRPPLGEIPAPNSNFTLIINF